MPQVVTIDFETMYNTEFSLTKLTTEQYVRSPLFEVIGIAIGVDNEPPVWYPKPDVAAAIAAMDWSDKLVLAQNTMFDAAILAWHYNVNPLAWLDTLGMSRALFPHEKSHRLKAQAERHGVGVKGDEVLNAIGKGYADFAPQELARYGAYCINDVLLTKELFDIYMGMGFPKVELKLIDVTLRMFTEPRLILDKPKLQLHLREVKEAKAQLLDELRDMMLAEGDPDYTHEVFSESTEGIKKLLMSNDKFATLLRTYGVEPPTKISSTTKKEAYAFAKTDEVFTALREHPDTRVQGLVEARLGNKTTIEETRTERFIGMADRGAFPVPLRYYGAHSGRWSGQDSVNMQNLPSRGTNAGRIKKAIVAPEGYVVIDCDSSQIEARVLAWLAGQDDLVAAFERKEDVYKIMAAKIYNVTVEDVTPPQRTVGKTVVLGAGYGVGSAKLQLFLKTQARVQVDVPEAKRIVDAYRNTYNMIPLLWRQGEAALKALAYGQEMVVDKQGLLKIVPGKGMQLPNGLFIQYPDLRRVVDEESGKSAWVYTSKGLPVHIYGGKVVENFCQAVARIIIGEQMLRIQKRTPPVLTVHDAVATIAKVEDAEATRAYVEECMNWRPKWAQTLPLACESGMGKSYGDC
jgi:DNA polymerase